MQPPTPPDGYTTYSGIHSHGAHDPNYNSNSFSQSDKNWADKTGTPLYITTPDGSLRMYDPKTKKETIISTNLPKDPNPDPHKPSNQEE